MSGGVRFDEEQGDALPPIRPRAVHDSLGLNVQVSPGQAQIILGCIMLGAICGSLYLIASAVPPPPRLGDDVLRPGERIPHNRTL